MEHSYAISVIKQSFWHRGFAKKYSNLINFELFRRFLWPFGSQHCLRVFPPREMS